MSKQITIIAAENVQAPVQAIASLILSRLIRQVEDVDSSMGEAIHGEGGESWPCNEQTTACDYTVRSSLERLRALVGRSFDDAGSLLWEMYSALEPLRLVQAIDPRTSPFVTRNILWAIRDYDSLTSFLDVVSRRQPETPRQEPEIRQARRKAKSQEEAV